MRLSEEDRGPLWLRDYQRIDADIAQLGEFATRLAAEVRENYATHLPYVSEAMTTPVPPVSGNFPELLDFMLTHRRAQDLTQTNVYNYRDGTGSFANAAAIISDNYAGADAFAHARIDDVDRALAQAAAAPAPTSSPDSTGYSEDTEVH